jgi:hypothetical protein
MSKKRQRRLRELVKHEAPNKRKHIKRQQQQQRFIPKIFVCWVFLSLAMAPPPYLSLSLSPPGFPLFRFPSSFSSILDKFTLISLTARGAAHDLGEVVHPFSRADMSGHISPSWSSRAVVHFLISVSSSQNNDPWVGRQCDKYRVDSPIACIHILSTTTHQLPLFLFAQANFSNLSTAPPICRVGPVVNQLSLQEASSNQPSSFLPSSLRSSPKPGRVIV